VALTSGVIWLLRVHDIQGRRHVRTLAFTGENDLALVVRAAYGGLVNRNLRLQLGWTARTIGVDDLGVRRIYDGHRCGSKSSFTHCLCLGERDLLNNRRLVEACPCRGSTGVLDEEDFIPRGVPEVLDHSIRLEPSLECGRDVQPTM
jgi:hypothetical protein